MKVSEAIEKLTVKRDDALHFQKLYRAGDVGWSANESKAIAFNIAINTLQQIDEPQAEKVKLEADQQFVADWYEANKWDLEGNMFSLTVDIWEKGDKTDFEKWFNNGSKNCAVETLIKMKLYGYTVKPKRWVVRDKDRHGVYINSLTITPAVSRSTICGKENAYTFDDKSKAKAVAALVEGSVEEID